jgi:hypothetical protein
MKRSGDMIGTLVLLLCLATPLQCRTASDLAESPPASGSPATVGTEQTDDKEQDAVAPEKPTIQEATPKDAPNTLPSDDAPESFHGVVPMIGTVSTGSGPSLGVAFWSRFVESSAAFSFRGYQLYRLRAGINLPRVNSFVSVPRWGDIPRFASRQVRAGNGFFSFAEIQLLDKPREKFYGIGPESIRQGRSDYAVTEMYYDGVVGYHFGRRILIGLRGGLAHYSLEHGTDSRLPNTEEVFDPAAAPGISFESMQFWRAGPGLFLDYRDTPGNPHMGGIAGLGASRFLVRDSLPFDFTRITVDARHFLPLGSPRHVVAFRLYTSLSRPDSHNKVPFFLMETLGGGQFLRGYPDFRFRDNNLWDASIEYRWEPISLMEVALFYDTGNVFPNWSRWDLKQARMGYGVGIRFKMPETVLFRIDFGHSREDNCVYLGLGSSV